MLLGQLCWCTATQGGLSPLRASGCASECCARRISGGEHCQAHQVPVLSDSCKGKYLRGLLQKGMYLLAYMLPFVKEYKQKYPKSFFNDTLTALPGCWWHWWNCTPVHDELYLLHRYRGGTCHGTAEAGTCSCSSLSAQGSTELRSLFSAAVETPACGADSVLPLCSEHFPGRGFRLTAQTPQTRFSRTHYFQIVSHFSCTWHPSLS